MNHIQSEFMRMLQGKTMRSIDEWGKVYVDSLTMSIRSRLSLELSYALTTLNIIVAAVQATYVINVYREWYNANVYVTAAGIRTWCQSGD